MKSDYREKFNRFFPALTCFVCFLFGFAGATLITGRVATVKYGALKAEFAEYKDEVAGYEHFVDFYPTCDTMVIKLDSTSLPYLFDVSDFVKWQNNHVISSDSNHTKVTFHGFTLNYSGVEVIRDTVKIVSSISQDLDETKEARKNSLLSLLVYEKEITRVQIGQIIPQDYELIRKMAYHVGGDLQMLKSELQNKGENYD